MAFNAPHVDAEANTKVVFFISVVGFPVRVTGMPARVRKYCHTICLSLIGKPLQNSYIYTPHTYIHDIYVHMDNIATYICIYILEYAQFILHGQHTYIHR